MNKSILIIEEDECQAQSLLTALRETMNDCDFSYASNANDIMAKIITQYYSIAIVDINMNHSNIDGFMVMDHIINTNSYAKIIVISDINNESMHKISEYLTKGNILTITEKKAYQTWIPELSSLIQEFFLKDINPIAVQILENLYAQAKNERNIPKKGRLFEEFVVGLFRQMGFIHIETRIRDKAESEIDIIVRNDLTDPFFGKFGRYIFVECKNRPELGFSKNDFIVFNKKVSSSNGDSNLGVVFTTGHISRAVYLEALRESEKGVKIIYLGSAEITRLIHTPNMLDEFKEIIDHQVA